MGERAEPITLDRALKHPVRERLVKTLWHSGEPMTASGVVELWGKENDLATVSYHLRVLESVEVVELTTVSGKKPPGIPDLPRPGAVLAGRNASEAVRRFGLGDQGEQGEQ